MKSENRFYSMAMCLVPVLMLVTLMMFPQEVVSAAKDGIRMCLETVIPALFPYYVVSSLIVKLGAADAVGKSLEKIMRPLFHVSGGGISALILGLVGGYPVGAKTAVSLYENGVLTRSDAERLLAFCVNAGPSFILGAVGAGVFENAGVGIILLIIHILSAVITGILFGLIGKREVKEQLADAAPRQPICFSDAFTSSVTESFTACIGLCGFIIAFTVLIRLFMQLGVISFLGKLFHHKKIAEAIISGSIELTNGVMCLKSVTVDVLPLVATAFMLGWGGVSVHFQTLSVLNGSGLSARRYFPGKVVQAFISAALAAVIFPAFRSVEAVSNFSEWNNEATHTLGAVSIFLSSCCAAAGLFIAFRGLQKYLKYKKSA